MKKIIPIIILSIFLISCMPVNLYTVNPTYTINPSPTVSNGLSRLEEFMNENNIKYTARDVQYDMANKLNVEFAMEGYAQISDYYNYGFDGLEKDYFSFRVTPINGKFSECWYFFCRRTATDFYNDLLKNEYVHVIVGAKIPDWIYQDGQDNEAFVSKIVWYR